MVKDICKVQVNIMVAFSVLLTLVSANVNKKMT